MTLRIAGENREPLRWPYSIGLGLLLLAAGAAGIVAGGYIAPASPAADPNARAVRPTAADARPAPAAPPRVAATLPQTAPTREPAPENDATTTICVVASASLRRKPSEGAEQVTEALFGHELEVRERRADWLRVRVVEQDYPGWIRESAVREVPLRRLDRRRVVAFRDTRPAKLRAVGALAHWPEVLPIGAVVMMADGIERGQAEVYGPGSDTAWVPTGHLGQRVGAETARGGGTRIAAVARGFLGTTYEWGGMTREGIDCSGLVWVSHFVCGYSLPRDSRPQSRAGQAVSRKELRPGDCLFFGRGGNVNHVGIYIGDGQFIHATPPRVTISDLDKSPHAQGLIRARRFTDTSSARADGPVVVIDTDRAPGNRNPAKIASAIEAEASVACPIVGYRELTVSRLADYDPAALVLSGQGTPWWNYSAAELDEVTSLLQRTELPILGICGGHQLLALAFGGTVAPIDGPQRGSTYADCRREKGWTTLQIAFDDAMLEGLAPTIKIWENHCEEVKMLPPGFVTLVEGSLSRYQAMRHTCRPVWGTQFHPEVDGESDDGRKIIRSFLQKAGVI